MMQFKTYFNMIYLQNLVGDAFINLMRGNLKKFKKYIFPNFEFVNDITL